jgi:predicted O-methyltransferase YrrM
MLMRIRSSILSLQQVIHDARAAVELSRIDLPYIPWPASALSPCALRSVLNEVEINERRTVVEFGSGVSTLYISKTLARVGGKMISVDDNSEWQRIVRTWVEVAGTGPQVTFVHAPLKPCALSLNGLEWYDQSILNDALANLSIDLALVDGPTAYEGGKGLARYPALPFIAGLLSEDCAIFLDDICRSGEQSILKKWSKDFGIAFEKHWARGGIARGVRGRAFYSHV